MTSQVTEETATVQAEATGEKPKANKKAKGAKRGAHVAPKKGKLRKKASPAKKAPKAKNSAKGRQGSKTDQVLELLKRPGGVTTQELMKATGWQPHSVRGFLSATVRKKMRHVVISSKGEDGERSYSIKG